MNAMSSPRALPIPDAPLETDFNHDNGLRPRISRAGIPADADIGREKSPENVASLSGTTLRHR